MAAITHPSLTNSQQIGVRRWLGGRQGPFARFAATLRLWRHRVHERQVLARLSDRELADFGATTADVYRELATPFWLRRRRARLLTTPQPEEHRAMNTDRFDHLPHIEATLNYLAPMAERPRNYTFDPPPGVARSNSQRESHTVAIHDVRPVVSDISLDREGLAVLNYESAVRDFWDEDEVRRVYYPEVQRVMAEATGASKVFIFDHTLRRRVRGAADRAPGTPRQPATGVHVDHTATSGPQRVRDFFGDEAERLLRGRVQVINLWRPIRGPLRDAPLAVCDAGSVAAGDLVPSDLVYQQRVGETYGVTYNPAHRWFYVPEMQPDEALLLKCFDSATDGRARFAPHTAFDDPTAPADVLPRESIEIRTLVFHEA